ncbi:MAG: hypothetical protein AAGD86_06405 [Pseudomonadota bacterium]
MAEEHDVRIVAWPGESAKLEHRFDPESPTPVRVIFDEPPARVIVGNPPGDPFDVNMNMRLGVRDVIPVCLKLCNALCAESDYKIDIVIFDRPVATISLRGMTRLFNCRDEEL